MVIKGQDSAVVHAVLSRLVLTQLDVSRYSVGEWGGEGIWNRKCWQPSARSCTACRCCSLSLSKVSFQSHCLLHRRSLSRQISCILNFPKRWKCSCKAKSVGLFGTRRVVFDWPIHPTFRRRPKLHALQVAAAATSIICPQKKP